MWQYAPLPTPYTSTHTCTEAATYITHVFIVEVVAHCLIALQVQRESVAVHAPLATAVRGGGGGRGGGVGIGRGRATHGELDRGRADGGHLVPEPLDAPLFVLSATQNTRVENCF